MKKRWTEQYVNLLRNFQCNIFCSNLLVRDVSCIEVMREYEGSKHEGCVYFVGLCVVADNIRLVVKVF
jgi:hypothetical protein